MKAHVKNGRLVVDEPTNLPEGTEVTLWMIEGDDLDDDERARLHEALRQSIAEAEAGTLIDADEVLRELRSRP